MTETDHFAILAQLLNEEATVRLRKTRYGKMVLDLAEAQHAGEPVSISGLPTRVVVVKADIFASPSRVFKGTRGECRRADYVIIAEKDNNQGRFIICVEMKLGTGDSGAIEQQLAGAQCFIEYCRAIGRAFWKASDFLDGFNYRFVSIRRTGLPKQKTRTAREQVVHDQPERMLKITSPHRIEFNHLAGQR